MKKEYISMPLPIDNLFGETTSKAKEIVILLAVLAGIWIGWVVLLLPFGIKYWLPIVLTVVFAFYWASEIYGQGKKKRQFFKRQLNGDLSEEHNLIGITMIDGSDVFFGNLVVNFLVCDFKFYTDGNQLTLDFERFLDNVSPLMYNAYFVDNTVDEDFSDDISGVMVYEDKEVAQERYDYYLYNQEMLDAIKRYRVIVAVRSFLDEIEQLHEKTETLLLSDTTRCFTKIEVAQGDTLSSILGSDIGFEIDINTLLDNKYYDAASMSSLKVVDRG